MCDVNNAFLNLSKIAAAGNCVVFDMDGSYVQDKNTGEKLCLHEQGGHVHVEALDTAKP